ncbi:MAG TPA: CAP domain-containing protein [Methylomirabilota bacterium]|nr:CAP domain-containing protein [Methylomirabilota bacterium]
MLQARFHLFPQWLILFVIVLGCYGSSFIAFSNSQTHLFLRHTAYGSPMQEAVQAAASPSAHFSSVTQVKEVSIGYQKVVATSTQTSQGNGGQQTEWGISKQIDAHTWTIQVGDDARNATAQEILSALNSYRQKNGKGTLSWDQKLSDFASTRATYFTSIAKLDGHSGFSDFLNNQDGFHKLGFVNLGENSSYGYTLEAVHLIEWVYAGDKPHNDNQLSSHWSYVGIGVNNTATDLVFGGGKL